MSRAGRVAWYCGSQIVHEELGEDRIQELGQERGEELGEDRIKEFGEEPIQELGENRGEGP